MIPMSHEEVLSALRLAQTPEECSAALYHVEELARREGAGFWNRERDRPFQESVLFALLVRMRFYALVLTAQHLLMRELRQQSEARCSVH